MLEKGFYIIKEKFFDEINDPYLKGNKKECRPHYYCLKETSTGLIWMIPLSSRVDKYRKIIEKRKLLNKSCDILHIVKLDNGKESVFLIQYIFPITEEYIEREFTIVNNPLILTSEHSAKEIEREAKKIRGLINKNVKFIPTQPNIKIIIDKLLKNDNLKNNV